MAWPPVLFPHWPHWKWFDWFSCTTSTRFFFESMGWLSWCTSSARFQCMNNLPWVNRWCAQCPLAQSGHSQVLIMNEEVINSRHEKSMRGHLMCTGPLPSSSLRGLWMSMGWISWCTTSARFQCMNNPPWPNRWCAQQCPVAQSGHSQVLIMNEQEVINDRHEKSMRGHLMCAVS
jgi:hypothetical protein